MSSLISPRRIVREHLKSIRDDASMASIVTVFLLIPLLISVLIVIPDQYISYGFFDMLVVTFSILTGLLLTMVFVSLGVLGGADKQDFKTDADKRKLVRALHFNTLYAVLISFTVLVVVLLCMFLQSWYWDRVIIPFGPINLPLELRLPVSILVYFLVFHFVMSFLVILKRLESLVSLQIDSQSGT